MITWTVKKLWLQHLSHLGATPWVSNRILFSGVMVNCMCHLTSLRDAQITGTLFLGLSVGVSLEEMRIWLSTLSKDICPQMWVGIIPSVGGPNGTQRGRKGKFLHSWAGISIFSCHQTLELLVLRPSNSGTCISGPSVLRSTHLNELYHLLFWFSSLERANYGTSQPP